MGESKLTKSDIQKLFKESFEKNIEVSLPNSAIVVPTTDYNKMKNINVMNYLKRILITLY